MSDRVLYFVVSDDVYIFARFEDALSYYEVWDNSKDMLFDSSGKKYIFNSDHGNTFENELIDLMDCRVEVHDGQDWFILSRLISMGYIESGGNKTLKDICDDFESRFGIAE